MPLTPFPDYFGYLKIFRTYLGRKIYVLFVLSLLAVAADGLGIMMLLPLLKVSELTAGGVGEKTALLIQAIEWLGFPQSQRGVLAFMAMMFVLKGVVVFGEGAYRGRLTTRLEQHLKTRILHHYSEMAYTFYAGKSTGHFMNVVSAQVNLFLQSFLSITQFSAQIITTSGYLLFALLLSWHFTTMAIVGGVVVLLLFQFLSEFSKNLSITVSRENGTLQKLLIQIFHAFKYLSSTASIQALGQNAARSIGLLASYKFKLQVVNAFTTAAKEPIAILFLILVLMVQITFLEQPIGPIFVALILFYRAMFSLISIQNSWQMAMNSIGGVKMVTEEFEQVQAHQEVSGAQKIGALERGIVFKDVTFAYDGPPVLQHLNLTIPANTTVAIVGESGAGKSTLVDLITLILKPQTGRIIIDGVPHTRLDYQDWRSHIGFVTQETVVFDDTLAANITLWTCDAEKDDTCRRRMEEAARQAHCTPFIEALPQKYDTLVGDRGITLSGGQRQRLFLARELFKQPRLLILDEATSALDTESERYIQKSIDQLKGKMTVVVIAHRLSTIKNADHIYVLDYGRIIEEGPYQELLHRQGSRFKKMVALQQP